MIFSKVLLRFFRFDFHSKLIYLFICATQLNHPHVPIFASSLGLLEPIKLKANQENESKEHITNHVNYKETTAAKVADASDRNSQLDSVNNLNRNQLINDLGSFDTPNQPGKFVLRVLESNQNVLIPFCFSPNDHQIKPASR